MLEDRIWAGTEESLKRALNDDAQRSVRKQAGEFLQAEYESPPPSRLLSTNGPIARLSVSGTLTNEDDAEWNEFIGHTGYPEIRQAMVEAANDSGVRHIVLDIDSPGGSVNGLEDTARLVAMINARVKPVTAFAGGRMLSAAYWLGASAGEVFSTNSAELGSIGVLATHAEQSERLQKEGVTVTVIRAGKHKALASPYEKLTDEARASIQAKLDFAYRTFVEWVAEARGRSYEYTDSVMAQGREFFGKAALDAGLIDGLTSFDALMSTISQKYVDASINSTYDRGSRAQAQAVDTQEGTLMRVKKVLTDADIAALAAGVALTASSPDTDSRPGAAPAATGAPLKPEGEGATNESGGDDDENGADENDDGDDGEGEGEAPAEQEQPVTASANVDTSNGALRLMSAQLKSANDELLSARVALSRVEDKLAQNEAVLGPLKDIAAKATNNMRVALQSSALDMDAMSAQQVLAEHAAVAANFAKAYKAGGVSSASAGAPAQGAERMSAMTQARMRLVNGHK